MQSLFYIHFNAQELKERIALLKELNIQIDSHHKTDTVAKLEKLPDVFVISLDRLPSHGRQYAKWIWETKKRKSIPIIFVDGQPDKIHITKQKFPEAIYCQTNELVPTLKKLLRST